MAARQQRILDECKRPGKGIPGKGQGKPGSKPGSSRDVWSLLDKPADLGNMDVASVDTDRYMVKVWLTYDTGAAVVALRKGSQLITS